MLTVENIYSGYQNVPVLKDIDFKLEAGEICGLIGLNGAGKSTLLKTILGLIQAQQGRVLINQMSQLDDHEAFAKQMAYIPETPILYDALTLQEHLEMTSLGYGIAKEEIMKRAMPLLRQFRLDKRLSWFPTHFSKGMKQKVMIICALITDAKLLIIDEPFLGLDPLAIRDFTNLLKARAEAGTTILLTTHVLSIAPTLCDSYLFLQAGEIRAKGNIKELQISFKMPEASLEEMYLAMTDEEEA